MVPTILPTPGVARRQFRHDVTVTDGASIDPGVSFDKTWRVNTRGLSLGAGLSASVRLGDRLGDASSVPCQLCCRVAQQISPCLCGAAEAWNLPGCRQLGMQPANRSDKTCRVDQVSTRIAAMSSISFRADPPYVNGGACTTLHWDARGARDVLSGWAACGQTKPAQVCPCQRTTYVLRVVGQTDRWRSALCSWTYTGPAQPRASLTGRKD